MDLLSNGSFSFTSKQKEYKEYSKKQGYRLLSEEQINSSKINNEGHEARYWMMVKHYMQAVQFEEMQGTLCAVFLEDNW